MARILGAFGAGLLFGLGLAVSQMVNPAKVLAFLDVAGGWDPSLALVLVAAVAVSLLGYRLALSRPHPVLAESFSLPTRSAVNTRLVAGAILFGIGWGLTGLCPGPAIASIAFGMTETAYALVPMIAGLAAARFVPE